MIQDEHSLARELEQLKNRRATFRSRAERERGSVLSKTVFLTFCGLFVHFVITARGERLFHLVETQSFLRLTGAKTYKNGLVGLYYQKASHPRDLSAGLLIIEGEKTPPQKRALSAGDKFAIFLCSEPNVCAIIAATNGGVVFSSIKRTCIGSTPIMNRG